MRHEFAPAENDKTFTVSFWAKVDAEQGQSREVDMSTHSPDEESPGLSGKTIVLDSTDWKEYTHTFVLDADCLLEEVRVGLCVAQSDVDFWIDDFLFFEDEPVDDTEKALAVLGKLPTVWGSIRLYANDARRWLGRSSCPSN